MKTDPITPPPELVEEWWGDKPRGTSIARLATQAAQWGADQELEACCEWLEQQVPARDWLAMQLRTARRPKPPSLKERALAVLDDCSDRLDSAHENTIRRALEALDD